jgi:sigma-B regulation protein RsbU (phosphoserine phosphatase)
LAIDFDNVPNGYVSFNDKGIIVEINATLCKMLGYLKSELDGLKFEYLLDIAGRIFFQTHFFPLLKMQESVHEIFLNLKSKNGTLVPVITSAKKVETGDGTLHVCIFLPVPNRRKYEEEILAAKKKAEQALNENKELIAAREAIQKHSRELNEKVHTLNKLHDELLQFNNIVNHEMQECVRKILLFSRLGQEDKSEDYSEKVIKSAIRLKTINSSLNLFLGLNHENSAMQPVNLNECLKQAEERISEETGFTGLEIVQDTLPEVQGIADDLTLLFFHLLSNAVKFRHGDHVRLSISCAVYRDNIFKETSDTYEYHDVARITFSDDGHGFDSAHKDYVFSMFKKLHSDPLSSGIGLSLCKKIVEKHGGNISIDSIEDVGTTVTIILPFTKYF